MMKRMKVLLIKTGFLPHNFRVITPPLGIAYLAGYLREKEPGIDLKLIDMRTERYDDGKLYEEIKRFSPDVVGISSITMEANEMHRVALITKRLSPKIKVIAGGPHPTLFYEDVLKDMNIDYVVRGEGEITFHKLLNILASGNEPKDLKGIARRDNGNIVFNGPGDVVQNLDEIPFPAWDMLPLEWYWKERKFTALRCNIPYIPLYTERGCPYGCIYCHNLSGRMVRKRSPENILEEMDFYRRRWGIRRFEFVDDIFNVDLKRVHAICEGILRRGWDTLMSFPNGLRSDNLPDETLRLLRRCGTYYISFAIESASPRIQKLIRKNLNIEKARRAIETGVKLGIFSMGYFMLGFPTETKEEIEETIKFASTSKLHFAAFFIVTPFEGTDIYRLYVKDREFKDYKNYHYHYTHINLSQVDDKTLKRLYRKAYLSFYYRPTRSLRIWRDYPFNKIYIFAQFLSLVKNGFTSTDRMKY